MVCYKKKAPFYKEIIQFLNEVILTNFDTIAKLVPSTSQEIATAASLNERYVREWLGGLVTSKIVDYQP